MRTIRLPRTILNPPPGGRILPEAPAPKPMTELLIVEDEAAIRELVAYVCHTEGFETQRADCVASARAALAKSRPDLIILDWMLPDMSGLDWLRELRSDPKWSSIPVIMLTARGDEDDLVQGLDTGADDYIVKPFMPRQLVARIRANLRRRGGAPDLAKDQVVTLGPLRIDELKFEATVDGKPLKLSAKEFKLLHIFASKPGRVFSRAQLLEAVWQSAFVDERTVDVHMLRLRKALSGGSAEDMIETVRGVGYRAKDLAS